MPNPDFYCDLLTEMSRSQAEGRGGSAYIAINSVVVAIAGVPSGLFGGLLACREVGNSYAGSYCFSCDANDNVSRG